MIKKKPKDLRSLFKVLESKNKWALDEIYPLSYKLQSIFSSEQKELRENLDKQKFVKCLFKLEEPYSFVKLSKEERKIIQNEMDLLLGKKKDLLEENKNLALTFEEMSNSINFLPNNFDYVLDRLQYVVDLIEGEFADFMKYHRKKAESFLAGKTFNEKDYYFRMLVLSNRILEMLYYINSSLSRPNSEIIDSIDEWLFSIVKFICTNKGKKAEILDFNMSISKMIDEINFNIDEIRKEKVSLKSKIVKFDGDKYVDYWIESMEDTMLDIRERQSSIELEIEELDEKIEKLQRKIDNGLYLRRAFWKDLLENYEDYPDIVFEELERQNPKRYGDWLISLIEYITSVRIETIFDRNYKFFGNLKNLYDESLEVYKKAKRSWNKNQNDSNAVALRRSKMYPVEIEEDSINYISRLKDLISNMEEVDFYLENTNKFYEDNYKLSLKIYKDLNSKLESWKIVFKQMFRGS